MLIVHQESILLQFVFRVRLPSPDVPKTVVDTLFEGCLGTLLSPWIGGTSISTNQGGKRRKRGGYFPVR